MTGLRRAERALGRLSSEMGAGALIVIAALLLIVPSLLNGFPFVLDDTMDYVVFRPRIYRSTFYSLFVLSSDFGGLSIWLPLFVQGLIVSHLVWLTVRTLDPTDPERTFVLVMLPLVGLSSLPFVTSYLMPDIFTSVMILSLVLLAFARDSLSRRERLYLMALATLAVSVHLSHVTIGLGVVASIALVSWVDGKAIRDIAARTARTILPILLAALALFVHNVAAYGIPALSPAGSVFLMGSLIGQGPARDYLAEACPDAGYRICAEADKLPDNSNAFLWGGTLERMGGFMAYRDEARAITRATIASRPLDVAAMSIRAFGQALVTRAPAADYVPLGWNTWRIEEAVQSRYGAGAVEHFRDSAQTTEQIPKRVLALIDRIVFPIAAVVAIAGTILAWRRGWRTHACISAVLILSVAANIFVCAAASGVFERYQGRVTWLVIFTALILAVRLASEVPLRSKREAVS